MIRSHWLQEVLKEDREVAPRLEGEVRADVCIVGGGYTGLWTAIRLKEQEPSLDVAIVERDICGGGASGRNSGFVLGWWAKILSMEKICGTEEAIRLCKVSGEAVEEIRRFCGQNAIDAHYRRDGWLWAATCPAQLGSWDATLGLLAKHQLHPFRVLTKEEAQTMAGTPANIGGVFQESAASIHPARLVRGLRRVALERGVRIFENTPMIRLVRSTPPVVRTRLGSVKAERVVLALNAWGARFPEIRKAIVVISADMIITEPIPDRLAEIGWTSGVTVSDSRMLLEGYCNTLDGRIGFLKGGVNGVNAFAGRVGDRFDGETPLARDLERSFKNIYPMLSDVPIAASWIGPVDRSKSGLPMFGGLGGRPDILYGVGYSGNGVGPCSVGGRILASLVLGRKDEWGTSGLVRPLEHGFPPEPIRYIGAFLVRRAALAKDKSEHEGRKPGLLTRKLAAFAPAGIAPTQRKKASATAESG